MVNVKTDGCGEGRTKAPNLGHEAYVVNPLVVWIKLFVDEFCDAQGLMHHPFA